MPQLNKIVNFLNEDVLNGTGEKTANVLLRYVFIVFLSCIAILATILLIGSITLLLQSYLMGHISYQNYIFDVLGVTQGIREFNYRCLCVIGFMILAVTYPLTFVFKRKFKSANYSYILFGIGTLIIIWSMYLCISQNFIAFDSNEDISQLILIIGVVGNTFISINKRFAYIEKHFLWITMMSLFIYASYI